MGGTITDIMQMADESKRALFPIPEMGLRLDPQKPRGRVRAWAIIRRS